MSELILHGRYGAFGLYVVATVWLLTKASAILMHLSKLAS